MRLFAVSVLLLLFCGTGLSRAQGDAVSFNLSTSKSFAPGEQPKIHLYTNNVDALEFRVYRVADPVRFVENLKELHSFGPEASLLGKEQIDERTPLERFHDWKSSLWSRIRDFFRYQFSYDARRSLRAHQSALSRRSRIVSEAEFAQIPILNQRQLVARWRQLVPSTYVSDSNDLAIRQLPAGLYLLEATDGRFKAYTLVMVSQMALVTRTTAGGVLAFAVDRTTGAPIPGVKVDAGFGQQGKATGTTDADGTAELALPGEHSAQDNFWVVAARGDDVAVSTPGTWALTAQQTGKYAGYVFTDRPVYRPTHTVHWKALLRAREGNALVLPPAATLHVTIVDESGKTVSDQRLPLSAAGDLSGDFVLPRGASLGYYTLHVGDDADAIVGGFHVEDYRKPEYRVAVTAASKRTLEGKTMPVTVDARYFFGEPVTNAAVKYRIYRERHYWWGETADEDEPAGSGGAADDDADSSEATTDNDVDGSDEMAEQTAKLDSHGLLTLQVPTHTDEHGEEHPDFDYTVEAGVTDAANREITGRGRFLATYSTFRVAVEPLNYAVAAGQPARFRVTALDYDDKPISTRVHVRFVYRHYENGQVVNTEGAGTDVQTDSSGHAEGALPTNAAHGSSAELVAEAQAVQPGTPNPENSSFVWLMGSGEDAFDSSEGQTQIIADKKTYAPGDTAHLSITSATAGFTALVVTQGYTVGKRQVMHSDGKVLSFDLPITAEAQPNLSVSALFLKDSTLYQASKVLKVPPTQQALAVEIKPAKDVLQPQTVVSYDITTRDFRGTPVSADLSFGVVDEAIYSLYPDSSGDMLHRLYPQRYAEAQVDSSLDYYFSGEAGEKSPMLAMRNARYHPQLAQVKPGNEQKPRVRKAFPDTAYWAPVVHTDSAGHARVSFTFPDSLTTWRATVHAITAATQAGSAINRVLVRKDVLVRMGTPRFLVKGDELALPVIVHNYLPEATTAKLSLDVAGLDTVAGSPSAASVPSKGEATAMWRLRAAAVGTAKLTASAITNTESDALEMSFPVEPAGVAKALAHSGALAATAGNASATISFPGGTDPAAHSLRVEVSPSIAGSIFGALHYLTTFPYGCTEQTMSSYLPNVIVAEALHRLKVNGNVDPADLQAKMQAGLARLKDYQHDDGGWGWWKEDESRVFMTAFVVGGIGQGARVTPLTGEQQTMLRSGASYLKKALAEHPRMRPELRAAVVYALAQSGDRDLGEALDQQWSKRRQLEPEALAMTGLAMHLIGDSRATEAAQLLSTKAVHEGELVHWTGSYVPLVDVEENNDAEATAYALRLLSEVDPGNTALQPAAQWLIGARDEGSWWNSTEQTAMVIFGLVDYLAVSHELDADFTVDVLVNGKQVGQRHFTMEDVMSGATLAVEADAAQLQPTANTVQVVRASGTGRIYWSVRGRYYSTDKKDFQAGTLSLNLTRDYFKLVPGQKDGKVVYSLQPLHGAAAIGDVLAVHEAINGSPIKYLLLEDPIAAGTEFISNEDSYPIADRPGGWVDWYTHREFHDDHAAFFSTDFSGRQEVFYLIRVVNPGHFHISPARVEPMYQPEVQATSDALELDVPAPPAAAAAGGQQ